MYTGTSVHIHYTDMHTDVGLLYECIEIVPASVPITHAETPAHLSRQVDLRSDPSASPSPTTSPYLGPLASAFCPG